MKKLLRAFPLFCSLGLCNACVISNAPPNDAGFARVQSIRALEGCYQNRGEGGPDASPRFLSDVIWPKGGLNHDEVKAIRVATAGVGALRVTAEDNGKILRESLFVEGKDFHLNSGKIKIKGEPLVSLAYPAGNVFIGVAYTSQFIGIDEAGAGKMQEAGTLAGTAFVVIPVAGHFRDATRFPRASRFCDGS